LKLQQIATIELVNNFMKECFFIEKSMKYWIGCSSHTGWNWNNKFNIL